MSVYKVFGEDAGGKLLYESGYFQYWKDARRRADETLGKGGVVKVYVVESIRRTVYTKGVS